MQGPAIVFRESPDGESGGTHGIEWHGGAIEGASSAGQILGGKRIDFRMTIEGNDRGLELDQYLRMARMSVHWEGNGEFDLRMGYEHTWGPAVLNLVDSTFHEGDTGKQYGILVKRCLGLRIEGAQANGYGAALVHLEPAIAGWGGPMDPEQVITGHWRDVIMNGDKPVCDNPTAYFNAA